MAKPDYDTTLARIAGNILSGQGKFSIVNLTNDQLRLIAEQTVRMARAIVVEVKRTEPVEPK